MEQNEVKIAVIDSGVDLAMQCFAQDDIFALEVEEKDNGYQMINSWTDDNGHGTEIISIIEKITRDTCKCKIYSIKVLNSELKCSIGKLCYALEYIEQNLEIDILNLSLGLYTYYKEFQDAIQRLKKRGITIISAFDNNEKMESYPAIFPEVIGVSGIKTVELDKYVYIKDANTVQISDTPLCVNSKYGKRKSVFGNSYACALFTANVAKLLSKYPSELSVEDIINREAVKKESLTMRLPGKHKLNERSVFLPMETTSQEQLERMTEFCDIIGVLSLNKCLSPCIELHLENEDKVIPIYDGIEKMCSLKPDYIYISSFEFLGEEKEVEIYSKIFDVAAEYGIAVSCLEKPIEIFLDNYSYGSEKKIPWYEYKSVLL